MSTQSPQLNEHRKSSTSGARDAVGALVLLGSVLLIAVLAWRIAGAADWSRLGSHQTGTLALLLVPSISLLLAGICTLALALWLVQGIRFALWLHQHGRLSEDGSLNLDTGATTLAHTRALPPVLFKALIWVVLGSSLALNAAPPASLAQGNPTVISAALQRGEEQSPLWKPAKDASELSPLFGGTAQHVSQEFEPGQSYTVTSADTLWDLAAAQLGPEATVPQIAEHWPNWYHLNREVIGNDPNLIVPGQSFIIPDIPSIP